jgi:phenylpyruvate tautomerase PptA (4-oxalocrotonate tautomerase family)
MAGTSPAMTTKASLAADLHNRISFPGQPCRRRGSLFVPELEPAMPLAKIHLLRAAYDAERIARVSKAVQAAILEVLEVPPEDFFQIIHRLERDEFPHTAAFGDLVYSDELIVLEVSFIVGRPKERRLALLQVLNRAVANAAGIPPDDVFIVLYEVPAENVSFGRGLAQRAGPSPWPAHA